jgi:hypothetical protein
MEAERKKMKVQLQNNLMWMVVGVIIMGGVYFLSYYDVDEVVVSESKTFFEFVRTVLK